MAGKVKTLYSNREKTEALFPRTKTSAISNEDGVGLDALIENVIYSGIDNPEAAAAPIDADSLGGRLASEYATENFVTVKIAEAQLDGGEVDLSGYATKDDVSNAVKAIDYPVDSVNGKTGAVSLSAADVGARPSSWLPTIAEIGAAPDGHGLGTAAVDKAWSDVDSLVTNGWYRFQNINVTLNNVGVVSALLKVSFFGGMYGEQVLYAINTASGSSEIPVLRRTRGYGAWQPWECVNPPMEVGKEYRTTKRYVNKPVYTMAVNCGAMPNNSYKEVKYSVPSGSVKNVISCRGTTSQGDALPYVSDKSNYRICATPKYVQITTNSDKSPYTAVAIIEYIKN